MAVFTRGAKENPPNLEPAVAVPYNQPRPLTAAAARVKISDKLETEKMRKRQTLSDWQSEAWDVYDLVGEIKYAFMLTGAIMSRMRLFVAIVDKPSDPPAAAEDADNVPLELRDAAIAHLKRLESSLGGIPGLLRDVAINLSVTGEALDVDTPVATPDGLRRIGDLQDGDVIYGGDGKPCTVVRAHPIREGRPCYEVAFTGGVSVVADAEHLWQTHTKRDRMYAQQWGRPYEPSVFTTEGLAQSLYHRTKGGSEHINHAIPLAVIHGDPNVDVDLPVDPYLLGYWLGDGVTVHAAVTVHPMDQDHLREQVEKAGYQFSLRPSGRGFQIGINGGFKVALRHAGVLGNKHIPDIYFRASTAARLALLQGLIDSDGHIDKGGRAEFSNKNKRLMWGFVELASSLGVRVGIPRDRSDGTGRVNLTPCGVKIARLPRKADRLRDAWERDKWRYVKRVSPVPSRPVRCITVDSPDSTFLVTEHLIRTHNCYLVQQLPDPIRETPEQWMIRSTDEIAVDNQGKVSIRVSRALGAQGLEPLREAAFIGRIWRPHPRFHDESDSSMRSLLGLAADLLLLNRAVQATAKSRLNAGALFIPDGLAVAGAPDVITGEENGLEEVDEEAAAFEEELIAAMTTPIQDPDSASAVVPLLIRGPGELGALIKQFKFERSFDPALVERADRVLERLMQGIDVPKDVVTGLACVDEQTEIFTRNRGWQSRTGVAVGDEVLTLNHETGLSEWQPVLAMNVYEHNGDVLRMQSATHDSVTTGEHRWPTVKMGKKVAGSRRRWTTSGEGFSASDRIQVAAAVDSGQLPTEAKYTDDFVRLVALYTSDGWVAQAPRGKPYAHIAKHTQVGIERARSVMPPRTIETRKDGDGILFRLSQEASQALFDVAPGKGKIVSRDFILSLTLAQLELFLASFVHFGDGVPLNTGVRYWQAVPERLDAIELAAILTGRTVRRVPGVDYQAGTREMTLHGLTVSDSPRRTYMQPHKATSEWVHHEGTVWCPTTENGTWLARRGKHAFFTGNSVKYALTDDAQILTRYGWRYYTEVQPGDEVYTLNHETGLAEWLPLLEVNVHDHDGPVLHLKGRHHSSTSTAEHRWPVVHNGERRWTTSSQGFEGDDRIIAGADPAKNSPAKDAGFVRWATAKALGLHIGDKTPYPAMSRFAPDQERYDREVVDADGRLRLDWITSLTPKQAQEVLDTYCFVNRGWPEGDYMLFWDKDPRNLDAVEVAATIAGHAVHRRRAPVSLRNRGVDLQTANSTEAVLVSKTNRELRPSKMTSHWLHYTGKVWCPTTGNQTWLAKQGDTIFFTGNSNAVVINESMYRAHIEPLTLLLVDALTMMYMRPALMAAGFEKSDVDKVIVWYDPSDILTSADRAASASEGWDRYLLSGAAWRSAHGFAEADKPTGDELTTRIVIARGQVSPQLTEGVLLQVAPELMSAIRQGTVPEESLLETYDDEPLPPPEPEPVPESEPVEEPVEEPEPTPEPTNRPPFAKPQPPKPEPPKGKPEPPGRPGSSLAERMKGPRRAQMEPPAPKSPAPTEGGETEIPPELLEGLPTYAI